MSGSSFIEESSVMGRPSVIGGPSVVVGRELDAGRLVLSTATCVVEIVIITVWSVELDFKVVGGGLM